MECKASTTDWSVISASRKYENRENENHEKNAAANKQRENRAAQMGIEQSKDQEQKRAKEETIR